MHRGAELDTLCVETKGETGEVGKERETIETPGGSAGNKTEAR